MVEFTGTNPATTVRIRQDEQFRLQDQNRRLEEQAARARYDAETKRGLDKAIRSVLGDFEAGQGGAQPRPSGAAPGPNGIVWEQPGRQPQGQPQTSHGGLDVDQSGAQPQAGPAPNNGILWQQPNGQPAAQQAAAQPQQPIQIGGQAAQTRANLIRALAGAPGGGAAALKLHTASVDRAQTVEDRDRTRKQQLADTERERSDTLEDQAWEFYVRVDIQAASTLMVQSTGRDMPPEWKTREAVLRAKAADSYAKERYPTDIAGRRKFIEAYMADPGTALNTMIGEAPAPIPMIIFTCSIGGAARRPVTYG